jgi:hypothetical protein
MELFEYCRRGRFYHYIFVRLFSLSFMLEKKTYIQEVMVGDPIDQMIEIVPY